MKIAKNIIIYTLIAFCISTQYSYTKEVCDSTMCPSTQKVNGPISSFFSKTSGMNFIISKTIESQVKKQMDKALAANFKVKVTPFGAKSMLQGKFKKIEANAKSASIDGLYLSNITAESMCEYNHFIYSKGKVYTNENFILKFNADITSEDLQKIVDSPEYQKILNSLNLNVGGIQIFRVYNPKAELKDHRLFISIYVFSPLSMSKPKLVTSSMKIEAQNGRLIFSDIQTNANISKTNLNSILPIINKLNPLTLKANILENKESIIKINDISFIDNKMELKGLVIVPKNYYNN